MWLFKTPESMVIYVGLGRTAEGFTSEVEAIDVFNPTMSHSLPNYPFSAAAAFGVDCGVAFCGGHNDTHYSNECYLYDDFSDEHLWWKSSELNEKR